MIKMSPFCFLYVVLGKNTGPTICVAVLAHHILLTLKGDITCLSRINTTLIPIA
jgi:hypothetical protein